MPDCTAAIRYDPESSAEHPFLASYTHPCGLEITEPCATRAAAWEWLRVYDEHMQTIRAPAPPEWKHMRQSDLFSATELLNSDSPAPDQKPAMRAPACEQWAAVRAIMLRGTKLTIGEIRALLVPPTYTGRKPPKEFASYFVRHAVLTGLLNVERE